MSLSDRELRGATRLYCERGAQRLASGPRAFNSHWWVRLRSSSLSHRSSCGLWS